MSEKKKKYEYAIEYFTYKGKQYKIYGKTKAEAKKKAQEKLIEVSTPGYQPKKETKKNDLSISPDMTVNQWAEIAYDTYKGNSSDYKAAKSRYKNYIEPCIGHYVLTKVTPVHCQNIMNECTDMSFSHCDKIKQELKFIFTKAIENDLLTKNPANNLVLPKLEKGTHRSITEEEREHLYKVYETHKQFLPFIIMLECGCRSGEVRLLLGSDIDHKNQLLHIRGTKTDNADRYVGIPDDLYKTIQNTPSGSYIALNELGLPYTKQGFYRLVQRLYREMNLSMGCKTYKNQLVPPFPLAEDFEPYCLRHTYCTDLAKAGVDLRIAQKLMGHANIAMTAEIYTHVDQGQIIDANQKMNEYLNNNKRRGN